MGITEMWDQLVNCICRPPRDSEYTVEDLVGGAAGRFALPGYKGYTARRQDLTLTNKSGLTLQCSHYIPEKVEGRDGRLPCVIYCHCNSGSRRDCEEALFQLLPLGISVFALDFAGSGLSEGNWVTLGAHEVDDVQVAVDYLRGTEAVSTLGLWGRSMGAVTALLYSQRDPSIAGMVLDSPFSSLTDLMLEIVEEQQLPVPKVAMKMALSMMKRSVKKRAGFDLSEVTPLTVVPESFIPALFGHATGDTFIKIHHTHKLHAAYAGDKNLITVPGDHNSPRPPFFKSSVAIFFTTVLQLERMIVGGNSSYLQHNREFDAAAQAAAVAVAPSRSVGRPGATQAWAVHLDPIAVDSAATIPRLPVSTSPRQDAEEDASPPVLQRNGLVAAPTPEEGIDELLAREQDEEDEADLIRAIEASLQDQATQVQRQGAGQAIATQAVVVPVPAAPRTLPIAPTASDDELLQAAIALSLAEASGHHVHATATQLVEGPEKSEDSYVDLLVRELGGGLATPAQAAAK